MKRFIPGAILAALLATAPFAAAAEDGQTTGVPAIPRFAISGYYVDGNTLLPSERILELLYPFTGDSRDFGDVQQALEALQDEYRSRGYTTVHVILPEQELEQGTVRLKVIEGKLKAVRVEGNSNFDESNILDSFPHFRVGEVPDIDAVSATLSVANENPAKKATLQLRNSDQDDDLIASIRVIDERPWRFGLSIDNTGSEQTGDWRLGLLFQHANVFNLDHVLTLQYITSPEKPSKVGVYSVGYRIPIYSLAHSIDLFGGYSDVDSGSIPFSGADMKVSGKGIISGIRYNQNLARIGAYEHRLVWGFDYRIYENSVTILGAQLGNDVEVHPISITYAGSWKNDIVDLGGFLTGIHNIPGGSQGGNAAFVASGNSYEKYKILRYGGSFGLVLPGDWQERIMFNGQYTDDRLVSGEQFGLGGQGSVRGFLERELTSDWGHFASEEIYTPELAGYLGLKGGQLRLLAFYDVGHIVRVRPVSTDAEDILISSAGVGLRLAVGKDFSLGLDYGFVVNQGGGRERGDGRLHLKASMLF